MRDSDIREFKSVINVLLHSAREHKRSASMHRKQSKACLQKANELKKHLLSTKGGDKSHGQQ
jgi:hypothetical protein